MATDAVIAEPSTAQATVTQTPKNPYASGKLTREINDAWRDKKEVPEPQPQATAPADTSTTKTESEPSGKTATATETVKDNKQEKPESRAPGAEHRIGELTAEKKAAIERAEKAERELADLRKGAAPKTETPKSEPSQELKPPVKPKFEDFKDKTWQAWEEAKDKYSEDMADYKAKKAVQEDRQLRAQEAMQQSVSAQMAEARKTYADYDAVAKPVVDAIYGQAADSVPLKVIGSVIGNSPIQTHLLYALGKNPEALQRIVAAAKTGDTVGAIEEVMLHKILVTQELNKAKNGDGGEKKETPAKTATEEPKPTAKPNNEVGNRGAGPTDVAADAVRRGDSRTAMAEWTRKAAEKRGFK